MRQILLVFSLLLLSPVFLFGQVPDPGQVQAELNNRDIDQVELERRLQLRGIDINSVDPTDPTQVAKVEGAIKEVVDEMEAEKKNKPEINSNEIENQVQK